MGSDKIEVRLGGIYALERIAQDSARDHWTIMEVLTAFVREKSPVESPKPPVAKTFVAAALEVTESGVEVTPVTKDVQAVLTVIVRRRQAYDPPFGRLDLNSSKLSGANLSHTNLERVNLHEANLSGADLSHTNLFLTNLRNAKLFGANLTDANLIYANLTGALGLTDEQLRGAKLCRTTLPDGTISDRDCKATGTPLLKAPTFPGPLPEPPSPPEFPAF